jgi:hypothetical protein
MVNVAVAMSQTKKATDKKGGDRSHRLSVVDL